MMMFLVIVMDGESWANLELNPNGEVGIWGPLHCSRHENAIKVGHVLIGGVECILICWDIKVVMEDNAMDINNVVYGADAADRNSSDAVA